MADITLTAAMRSNLINLQNTNALLDQTQLRLSTGKKVNTALDNPTNFFAASAHFQRANDLTARKDGMTEAIQTIKASGTGISGVKTLLESAKGIVESSRSSTGDRGTLETQYNEIMSQVNKLVKDSGYKGVNFLDGTAQTLDVLFNETGTNKLKLNGFDAKVSTLMTAYTAGANFSVATALNDAAAALTAALTTLTNQSAKLSSNLSIVNARLDFTVQTVNVEKTGGDNLTLADMNEEGANMLMLQTRNQLGTTSLSLASQAAQAVLRLF